MGRDLELDESFGTCSAQARREWGSGYFFPSATQKLISDLVDGRVMQQDFQYPEDKRQTASVCKKP